MNARFQDRRLDSVATRFGEPATDVLALQIEYPRCQSSGKNFNACRETQTSCVLGRESPTGRTKKDPIK